MRERLILTITLASTALAFIFAASPEADSFSSYEMCTEVAVILQEAVDSGVISQSEADQSTQRCFNTQEAPND